MTSGQRGGELGEVKGSRKEEVLSYKVDRRRGGGGGPFDKPHKMSGAFRYSRDPVFKNRANLHEERKRRSASKKAPKREKRQCDRDIEGKRVGERYKRQASSQGSLQRHVESPK